jgi:uncharacterized membrane protein
MQMNPDDSALARPVEEKQMGRIKSIAVTSYSGPLPPPEALARFEELYPGSAKLIIDDFSTNRSSVEKPNGRFCRFSCFVKS